MIEIGLELAKIGNKSQRASVLGTLGNLYIDLKRVEDAKEAYQKSLEFCERCNPVCSAQLQQQQQQQLQQLS